MKAGELEKFSFKGKSYTVDFRLKEFRIVSEKEYNFIPFDSFYGELLLNAYLYNRYARKGEK